MKNKTDGVRRLAAACSVALLVGTGFTGEASGAYLDCRLCHLDPPPGSVAKDYFEYFAQPARQHPSGIAYPSPGNREYLRPTAVAGDVSFFDRNGNGVPDADEVQLFGAAQMVECASCHREHGEGPPPIDPNMYLRIATTALCAICHRL